MTTRSENHPMTFLILILIIIVMGTLGFTSLKNTQNTPSSIVYITPIAIPTNTPIPQQTLQKIGTDESEMTLEEAQQQKIPSPSDVTIIQLPEGLQLEWKAVGGDIINYTIYRAEGKNKAQKIDSKTAQKATELQKNGHYNFIDTTVQNDISYTYSVSATNSFNNESNQSETVSVLYKTLTVE